MSSSAEIYQSPLLEGIPVLNRQAHPLSIEEIEETGVSFKQDLQREANRAVRRHDSSTALAALEGIEYIEKFIYTLKIRAGSQLGQAMRPPRAKPIRIFKKD